MIGSHGRLSLLMSGRVNGLRFLLLALPLIACHEALLRLGWPGFQNVYDALGQSDALSSLFF